MPVISVNRNALFESLNKQYTEEEFDHLCFEFGIELDDVVEEEGEVVYKIDLPANRYDLLCIESLTRALRVFLGEEALPQFHLRSNNPSENAQIIVGTEAVKIRPFVVGAILRGVSFTKERYESFIALQDQLHRNICRRRTLVAIGTHDLDNMVLPAYYDGEKPEHVKFVHLFSKDEKELNGKEMLDFFKSDVSAKHVKEYVDIIYDSPVYPVVRDGEKKVLSLPPIINGKMSRITLDTKNVFIECTATDLTKANIVLNTVIAAFSEYCETKFQAEPVAVQYPKLDFYRKRGLSSEITPQLDNWEMEVDLEEMQSTLGVEIPKDQIENLCLKMQLSTRLVPEKPNKVIVTIPITRSDILHPVDVIEDVGIAYGYNRIFEKARVPPGGAGKELPVSSLTDLLRNDLARQGYTELMTFGLCKTKENFLNLDSKEGHKPVILANPKTIDFQQVRLALAPGALKTLAENKSLPYSEGIRLFEVSDVVYQNGGVSFNQRHAVALYAGTTAGVEFVHGTLDRIMQAIGVIPSQEYAKELRAEEFVQKQIKYSTNWGEYEIRPSSVDSFYPGMRGDVLVRARDSENWKRIGVLGAIHPQLLQEFSLTIPVSLLELNVQGFV
eukprot:snap_masked-scaffold_60-processed-gene-0.29-mRNA-1 protein AED:0.01 eAED:0.01 QI:0/-1/0/1/-1/1/1/0/613